MASVDTPDDQLISVNYGDVETDDWAAKHQISLAEHASRLDAKTHFDNRGRIIWSNGFEQVLVKWRTTIVGGGTIARSLLAAWRGGASILLTTGIAVASQNAIWKDFYNPETGRYGIEMSFSRGTLNNPYTAMLMDIYDGVNYREFQVRINGATDELEYYSGVMAWTGLGYYICDAADIHFWHKIKMVVDSDNLEYVRILFDGNEINMAGIAGVTGASAICPRIRIMLYAVGDNVGAYTTHIDDVILTHLEP